MMDWVYRGFESSLLGLALALTLGLGFAASQAPGAAPAPGGTLAVTLPMLTATVPAP